MLQPGNAYSSMYYIKQKKDWLSKVAIFNIDMYFDIVGEKRIFATNKILHIALY